MSIKCSYNGSVSLSIMALDSNKKFDNIKCWVRISAKSLIFMLLQCLGGRLFV